MPILFLVCHGHGLIQKDANGEIISAEPIKLGDNVEIIRCQRNGKYIKLVGGGDNSAFKQGALKVDKERDGPLSLFNQVISGAGYFDSLDSTEQLYRNMEIYLGNNENYEQNISPKYIGVYEYFQDDDSEWKIQRYLPKKIGTSNTTIVRIKDFKDLNYSEIKHNLVGTPTPILHSDISVGTEWKGKDAVCIIGCFPPCTQINGSRPNSHDLKIYLDDPPLKPNFSDPEQSNSKYGSFFLRTEFKTKLLKSFKTRILDNIIKKCSINIRTLSLLTTLDHDEGKFHMKNVIKTFPGKSEEYLKFEIYGGGDGINHSHYVTGEDDDAVPDDADDDADELILGGALKTQGDLCDIDYEDYEGYKPIIDEMAEEVEESTEILSSIISNFPNTQVCDDMNSLEILEVIIRNDIEIMAAEALLLLFQGRKKYRKTKKRKSKRKSKKRKSKRKSKKRKSKRKSKKRKSKRKSKTLRPNRKSYRRN